MEALEVLEHSRDPDAPLIRALLTTAQRSAKIFLQKQIFNKTHFTLKTEKSRYRMMRYLLFHERRENNKGYTFFI